MPVNAPASASGNRGLGEALFLERYPLVEELEITSRSGNIDRILQMLQDSRFTLSASVCGVHLWVLWKGSERNRLRLGFHAPTDDHVKLKDALGKLVSLATSGN